MNEPISDSKQPVMPSALERATARSFFDPTPLTTSVWTATRSETPGRYAIPSMLLDGKMIQVSQQTGELIVWSVGEPLAPDELLSKAFDLEERMREIINSSADCSAEKATAYVFDQRDKMAEDLKAGVDISAVLIPSRETVAASHRAKQAAYLALLVKITHEEVIPLVVPILSAFETAVEKFMRGCEERDREFCEVYGIPFHPSVEWRMAAAVAQSTRRRLPAPGNWNLPSSLLAGVINFNA